MIISSPDVRRWYLYAVLVYHRIQVTPEYALANERCAAEKDSTLERWREESMRAFTLPELADHERCDKAGSLREGDHAFERPGFCEVGLELVQRLERVLGTLYVNPGKKAI
jgi:hypothetical protein